MLVLAIESSCDETAAAVVEGQAIHPNFKKVLPVKVLSNVVATQIEFHEKYGGIVPEIASRRHAEVINCVIKEALDKSRHRPIDAVAVTYGPGLPGSLIVGLCAAKAWAWARRLPLIGVNHLAGHIYANFLRSKKTRPATKNSLPKFPFVALLVSGGHTILCLVEGPGRYRVLGQTRDDAVGEAYDKVARYLGLGFPGGPIIDRLAKKGNPRAIQFPRGMDGKSFGYDFSFSGLKTAIIYYAKKMGPEKIKKNQKHLADVCASFQEAAGEVLAGKTLAAAKKYRVKNIVLAGGVAANSALREKLRRRGEAEGKTVFIPPIEYCTDNAAMIGAAALYHPKIEKTPELVISSNLSL